MNSNIELLVPGFLFATALIFAWIFISKFKKRQLSENPEESKGAFWNNQYIFDSLPSIFPTLGILCTAIGITVGIWSFDAADIQHSIPELLGGLKLAFLATIAGIFLLLLFQKITAYTQKKIDHAPNKPRVKTDELTALAAIQFAVEKFHHDNNTSLLRLETSIQSGLEKHISQKMEKVENEFSGFRQEQQMIVQELSKLNNSMAKEIEYLRKEQFKIGEKANKNSDEIVRTMNENSKVINSRFSEFSDLLRKNNTEALVEVMMSVTQQFNSQMEALISRLVKENFEELNNSVKTLNDWQVQNKVQVKQLNDNYQQTTETFTITADKVTTLVKNVQDLTGEQGKLTNLIKELDKVMISDHKFTQITDKVAMSVDKMASATESFDETTNKLNDWIQHERNFKEAAVVLIAKLEEFRNLNGSVWDNYRTEMQKSVGIIKDTSKTLDANLKNINQEFYERLNDTLTNLDECIQRTLIPRR